VRLEFLVVGVSLQLRFFLKVHELIRVVKHNILVGKVQQVNLLIIKLNVERVIYTVQGSLKVPVSLFPLLIPTTDTLRLNLLYLTEFLLSKLQIASIPFKSLLLQFLFKLKITYLSIVKYVARFKLKATYRRIHK